MADLRYQWGDEEVQGSAAPPKATTVALLVGEHIVWGGDVTEELRAWARWCALSVAHLWHCSRRVRRFLETGDVALRAAALEAAEGARHRIEGDVVYAHFFAAMSSACAAEMDRWTPKIAANGATFASTALGAVANAVSSDHARAATITNDEAQAAHLRRLVLQRALPELLWPLVDGDERVLCDALLEARHG